MAVFAGFVSDLRRLEQQLLKELAGIQSAISSLEFGGAVSPGMPTRKRVRPAGSKNRKGIIIVGGRQTIPAIRTMPTIIRRATAAAATGKKRKKLSAKGRAAISRAQKSRWAKIKAAKAK